MTIDLTLPADYTPHAGLRAAFDACPLVAILRGVQPGEAAEHGLALYEAGFRIVEVPLNSPQPFASIAALRRALPADALIGAGTALRASLVREVRDAGGELIVMPHADPLVIETAKGLDLACVPGVATPTEAFRALAARADALKMFPAEQLGPATLKAWRSVMPARVPLLPVGGVRPDNLHDFVAAGASGFGLGSALYRPGQDAASTRAHARAFVDAWRRAHEHGTERVEAHAKGQAKDHQHGR